MQRPAGTGMFRYGSHTRVGLGVCLGFLTIAVGCASRGDVDALEARLRNQELQLREAQRRSDQLMSQLQAAQQEQDLLRSQIAGQVPVLPEEITQALAAATGLKFHTLLTAGQDRDGVAGDERLHVFLFPHDADGELVKLTGDLEVEVFDPSHPNGMQRIGHGQYTAEQARKLWHSGFLSSGFQTEVPLDIPPQGSKLVLHGRLTTIDGRQFDASHTVSVVTAMNLRGQPLPSDGVTPPPPMLGQQTYETGVSGIVPARFVDEIRDYRSGPGEPGKTIDRQVPDPYADRPTADPFPLATEQTAPPIERPVSLPPTAPFPDGLPTSDRWTDETIPAWR